MLIITLRDIDGVKQVLSVAPVNPLIKTLRQGKVYQAGHLMKLAAGEELTQAEYKESPALVTITQAQAVEMVEDAFLNRSPNIKIVDVPNSDVPRLVKKSKD